MAPLGAPAGMRHRQVRGLRNELQDDPSHVDDDPMLTQDRAVEHEPMNNVEANGATCRTQEFKEGTGVISFVCHADYHRACGIRNFDDTARQKRKRLPKRAAAAGEVAHEGRRAVAVHGERRDAWDGPVASEERIDALTGSRVDSLPP